MRPRGWSVVLASALGCQPVIPSPPDQPPWLGIAKSPQVRVYADSAILLDTAPEVELTMRALYTTEQRMPSVGGPYVESRFGVVLDCHGERARTLSLDLVAANGAKVASLPIGAGESAWQPFETHSLRTYFIAACIRMGRTRGRLDPS